MDADRHRKIIELWISSIVSDDGIERSDELHIDRIDSAWRAKSEWLERGLEAFHLAVELRDGKQLPFTVGLGFSLQPGEGPRGVDFHTPEEFCEGFNSSPPSLYLWHAGEEPHYQSAKGALVRQIDPAILGVAARTQCVYLEFRPKGQHEFYRSVFVEG